MKIAFAILLSMLSGMASADIFKCFEDNGRISYSNKRCSADAVRIAPEIMIMPPMEVAPKVEPRKIQSVADDLPPPPSVAREQPPAQVPAPVEPDVPEEDRYFQGEESCGVEEAEVKTAKRALKNWYPESMSEGFHQKLRLAEKALTRCRQGIK